MSTLETQQLRVRYISDTLEKLGEDSIENTLRQSFKSHHGESAIIDEKLFKELLNELEGTGPLASLIADPQITEIVVNGFDKIFYEKKGELHRSDLKFSSPVTFDRLIKRWLNEMERVADQRHPLVDGKLKDGTRVHVAFPPVTKHPCLSIRKHTSVLLTLDQLCSAGMFSKEFKQELLSWVLNKKNILICGATGSGKTTLLRALLNQVPLNERILTLEDTPEIGLTRDDAISLFTRQDPENLAPAITLQNLLVHSLRMRPDRIVVGEVRGAEALQLLDAMATGHRGSMSSLHAHSAMGALKRLESLVSRAAPQWSMQNIRQLIFDSIDQILIVQKENGLRKISQAAKISALESFGFLLDSRNFS